MPSFISSWMSNNIDQVPILAFTSGSLVCCCRDKNLGQELRWLFTPNFESLTRQVHRGDVGCSSGSSDVECSGVSYECWVVRRMFRWDLIRVCVLELVRWHDSKIEHFSLMEPCEVELTYLGFQVDLNGPKGQQSTIDEPNLPADPAIAFGQARPDQIEQTHRRQIANQFATSRERCDFELQFPQTQTMTQEIEQLCNRSTYLNIWISQMINGSISWQLCYCELEQTPMSPLLPSSVDGTSNLREREMCHWSHSKVRNSNPVSGWKERRASVWLGLSDQPLKQLFSFSLFALTQEREQQQQQHQTQHHLGIHECLFRVMG